MKKLLLLALSVVATGFSACSKDEPPPQHVYHHHVYHSDTTVGTPSNEGSDNFHAVTKPDSYSGQ